MENQLQLRPKKRYKHVLIDSGQYVQTSSKTMTSIFSDPFSSAYFFVKTDAYTKSNNESKKFSFCRNIGSSLVLNCLYEPGFFSMRLEILLYIGTFVRTRIEAKSVPMNGKSEPSSFVITFRLPSVFREKLTVVIIKG